MCRSLDASSLHKRAGRYKIVVANGKVATPTKVAGRASARNLYFNSSAFPPAELTR